PRMAELVGEQIADVRALVPFGEVAGNGPVLARLMVLEPDAAHLIGEREQELVVIVMMRTVELVRLLHHRTMRVELLRFQLEHVRSVRDDVQMDGNLSGRIEVETLQIPAREHRRVDERLERDRLERREARLRGGGFERGPELPPLGQPYAGFDFDLP